MATAWCRWSGLPCASHTSPLGTGQVLLAQRGPARPCVPLPSAARRWLGACAPVPRTGDAKRPPPLWRKPPARGREPRCASGSGRNLRGGGRPERRGDAEGTLRPSHQLARASCFKSPSKCAAEATPRRAPFKAGGGCAPAPVPTARTQG